MHKNNRSLLGTIAVAVAAMLAVFAAPAKAQDAATGVTGNTIRIGSCLALSGPASFLGMQTEIGAKAYFAMINAQGGINGRTVELVMHDDGYDPAMTTKCFNQLLAAHVFAAGFFVGTPTAVKYVPMAEEHKIPVVGLFTGAQILYEPLEHYIINVRASYFDETRTQVDHLWNDLGIRRIGVIYQNDAFGKAVLEGVQRALARYHAAPIGLGTFERNTLAVNAGISAARKDRPEAVIVAGPYAPMAAILKQSHAEGWHPLFLTVSFVGTEGLVRAAGDDAEGTVVTQVVPPYGDEDLPTVKMYRDALNNYMGGTAPTFVSFEGFVDAMVMAEGLKRAGRNLTREKLISAIESIHEQGIGLGRNFLLNYSATRHQGFSSVIPTVIRAGKPEVITNWRTLRSR